VKEFCGYNLIVCQNVTDIDDKIIIRSSERGLPFRELAAKYEAEFFEDLARLGVAAPDMITRVSEYMPEIIDYIKVLVDKGIAYEMNGSVYFDTIAYQTCGHVYGKLVPEQMGNSDLLAEGEGALAAEGDAKKSAGDFALWKKTKDQEPGSNVVEPHWESPWGNGRPGWHIECSVMSHEALKTLGDGYLDVHAGGVDLKFPHHENEEAQSAGYLGCKQWTNYWIHTGHLNIKGAKMSKSLKNFITIREALEMHTPRQVRFCFALHKYNSTMDYSADTMAEAVDVEKKFTEFFHNVKAVLRRESNYSGKQYVGEVEERLVAILEESKKDIRAALLNDFDTPVALKKMMILSKEVNKYLDDGGVNSAIISSVAKYITGILRVLGLVPESSEVGFPLESVGEGGGNKEEILAPFLDAMTKFREMVRVAAMNKDPAAVLQAADALRDDILPELGVRMEDKGSGSDLITLWKLDDPEVLKLEREQKRKAKEEKERAKAEAAARAREKEEKSKIPPQHLFVNMTDLYSAFDADGIPTHNTEKEPLSKGQLKKLKKEWDKQNDLHQKYLTKNG